MEDYRDRLGLAPDDAFLLASDDGLARFFEETVHRHENPKAAGNWVINELRPMLKDAPLGSLTITPATLAELIALIDDQVISGKAARQVFTAMLEEGGSPADIIKSRGLQQVADAGQLEPIVDAVIAAHPDNVTHYREGKTNLLGFFVGQVMKSTNGKANPRLVNELLRVKTGLTRQTGLH